MRYLPIATQYIKSTSLAVSIAENAGSLFEEENVSPMFDKTCRTLQTLKNQLKDHIYRNRFVEAMYVIQKLLQTYSEVAMSLSKPEQRDMCSEIDASIQEFLLVAFTTPLHQDYRRVLIGMDVMHLQLSKSLLCPPFNTIPRRILLNAIAAITSLPNEVTNYTSNSEQQQLTLSRSTYVTMSYRFLQRLISRVGVRGTTQYSLTEKEFNQVLHAHCKIGHMTSAERIVKLQERTIRQTPISLVTFSILLKGYGQNNDLSNVERTIQRAKERYSTMDTIMINTIIDAYINCNAIEQAELFFSEIKRENAPINRRTYNTYMKGLAKQGELGKAIDLALEMKHKKLWDSITTNTLVHTSIIAGNVTYAEEILEKETMRSDKYRDRHPNVEAYTELLDTYSKANQLDRSLSVLQTMQRRNVEPNEVTYTCLMGGLGRNHRIDLAHKILTYMETRGQRPTTKMYNALFSGLLYETNSQGVDSRVDDGMKLLVHMKQTNVQPNSITVSIIVDALGRCTIPRVVEAQMLVDEFVRSGCISKSDNRVLTSLLNIYGRVGNFEGVMSTFQNVERPDTVAVNAFIDACCRCGREKLAIDAFELYFRTSKNNGQRPDVVTYAILIGSILKRSSTEALRQVRLLYADMKNNHKIFPDSGLIDVILKSMIRIGSTGQLTKQHAMLITDVLQDAERLHWEEEQLNRRKRAIRATILESFGNTLRPNDPIFDIVPPLQPDNDLFSRKGWNQVHSGFRLWGPPVSSITSNDKAWNQGDDFLNSHGWNDVDSKFRVI
jgi:pentatricopeptide repeat protein